ncbi:MAG: hypothetical protein HW421_382 [Ignavibacteria bacterium]|nr:hypothetical protein [Ignavibacteria bacterium]
MKKLILFAAGFCMILSFISCSDSTTSTPSTGKTYIPIEPGTWWKYSKYALGSDGKPDYTTSLVDSIIVSSTKTYFGKTASEIVTFNGKVRNDTVHYFYATETAMYASNNYVNPPVSMVPQMSNGWSVLADSKSSGWNIFDTTLTSFNISYGGTNVSLSGKYTIKGVLGKKENVVINDNGIFTPILTQEYQILYSFDGTISLVFPLKFTITYHYWINSDIGIVKEHLDPLTITALGIPIPVPGTEKILMTYNISKK